MHTIMYKPPLTSSFNHASYLIDDTFERNPLLISSVLNSKCCSCCCCYYTSGEISMCNRLGTVNPSFLCKGVSQMNLIQWSICKRLNFNGGFRQYYGNTSGFSIFTNLDRSYNYEKICAFKEKRKRGFGNNREKHVFSNVSDDCVNDVEVMLSLLTDELGLERIDVKNRKKINKEKNNVGFEVIKRDFKRDETVKIQSLKKKENLVLRKEDSYGKLESDKDFEVKYVDPCVEYSHEVDKCNDESGSRMKYKRFTNMSDKDKSVIESTSTKENKLKPISKPQESNISRTSLLYRTRIKSLEEKSTKVNDEHDGSRTRNQNEGGSRHSSQGSGPKGPSDEMWHVSEPSSQEPSETDEPNNTCDSSETGQPVKTSGKSVWTMIGDMVRLHWKSPRCGSRTPYSNGAKGSSVMSTSDETWFSSHEQDDLNDYSGPSRSTSLPIIDESLIPISTQQKMDEFYMSEALLEAKKAANVFEIPVGAVLVKDGKIIARGYNLVEELRDSTAHAEIICIRKASTNLQSWRLLDTTLYVTLEPCAMCAGAILQARIHTVVWGAPNKLLGADGSWIRLFSNGDGRSGSMPSNMPPAPPHPFHPNMAVRRGVLAAECAEIIQNFFRLRRKKIKESESPITPLYITVSHHHHFHNHSNFLSKIHHAFKIIFWL